jgi:hypothetical protein
MPAVHSQTTICEMRSLLFDTSLFHAFGVPDRTHSAGMDDGDSSTAAGVAIVIDLDNALPHLPQVNLSLETELR